MRLAFGLLLLAIFAPFCPAAAPQDPGSLLERLRAEVPLAPHAADGVTVRVEDPDGKAVAELDLVVVPVGGWTAVPRAERKELLAAVGKDPVDRQVALITRVGARYKTDAEGRVVLAPVASASTVMALHPATKVEGVLRPDSESLVLTLRIEDRVRVRVVDGFKRPVSRHVVSLRDGSRQVGMSATDDEGFAWIGVPEGVADRAALVVRAAWPSARGTDGIDAVVGNHRPGDPAIVLQFPPTGMVRFILYDVDERPVERLESAQLVLERGGQRFYKQAKETEADSALFDHIQLDYDLVVTARVRGIAGPMEVRAKGPTRAGELIIVEGRLAEGPSLLRARLLDLEGRPLAEESIGLAFVGNRNYRGFEAKTDADGRLEIVLPDDVDGEAWAGLTLFVDARGEDGAYYGMAAEDLDQLLDLEDEPDGSRPNRSRDLADLQLVEPPTLASGVVVDSEGKPLEGMRVSAASCVLQGSGSRSGRQFFQHEVVTDAEGRFTLRELDPRHAPVRVSVHGGKHRAEGVFEAALGERDVVIEARRTGSLSAQLAGGPFHGANLSGNLLRRGAPADALVRIYFQDGKAKLPSVPFGTYDLELTASHRGESVEIKGIEVPAGGEANDPRLAAIDWTTGFRLVHITVRDEAQRPIARQGTIWCYISDGQGGRSGSGRHTDDDGQLAFFCPLQRCEISAKVEGFLEETVPADKDEIVFDLEAAPKVRVTLPADLALPKGLQVSVELVQGRNSRWSNSVLLPGETKELLATKLGAHAVVLQLSMSHREANPQVWNRFRELFRHELELVAEEPLVEMELELDEAAVERLQAAAEALGLGEEGGDGRR